jgi:tetratricopeptide (TPR) repeat protein
VRRRGYLFTLIVVGFVGSAISSAQRSGRSPKSGDLMVPGAPSQNPSYDIWDDRGLDQLAGPVSERQRGVTLLDEIEDPGERRAFAALYEKQGAQGRLKTAEEFLQRYPGSAFVSQAFEIAAKASIDLGDYKSAVRFGRESLHLLPENPLLLVPLADVEVKQGDTARAVEDAKLALDCLDRFTGPAIYSEKEWKSLARQLRATCNYVLGKAVTAEALNTVGPERQRKLQGAEEFAEKSLGLNPSEAATAYLLGLIRLARGNAHGAGEAFAIACQQEGPLRARALQHLQAIYTQWPSKAQQSFEAFVRELANTGVRPAELKSGEDSKAAAGKAPAYVGSDSCQSCHPRQYAGWQNTGHSKMFRSYRFENVFGDFNNATYKDERGKVVARFTHNDTQHYVDIMDGSGKWHHYRVDYTIGSKWQQTYGTRLPSGEIQVIPLQYNRDQKVWSAFWKTIDPANSPRAEVTNFPKLSFDTAYLAHCGPCHTSQLRSTATTPTVKDLVCAEGGINCEMCHGACGDHVASMRQARLGYKPPLKLQVEYGKLDSRDYVAICSQCHLQSAQLSWGPEGELNYRHFPDTFYEHYQSRPYMEFALRTFYKDGRFRPVSFIVESFLRTQCYQKGRAQCGHCHDFHPSDPSNIRGLKFLDDPNRMCLQCHPQFGVGLETHTHHAAKSEGSRCTACHMPKIMTTVMFRTMTHTIDDIPSAEMTALYGQGSSPNACLICHADKDPVWLKRELSRWNVHKAGNTGIGSVQ